MKMGKEWVFSHLFRRWFKLPGLYFFSDTFTTVAVRGRLLPPPPPPPLLLLLLLLSIYTATLVFRAVHVYYLVSSLHKTVR